MSERIAHFAHVSRNSLILPLVSIITFTALLSRARGLAGYDTAFTRRGSCVRIASGPPKLHFIYTFIYIPKPKKGLWPSPVWRRAPTDK